jgi:spermidine synthase
MSRWFALSLAFFTSAAVLVLEVLAMRVLAPYVGVTLQTYTAIIGVVLAGIAAGNWIGGRMADRFEADTVLPIVMILGGLASLAIIPSVKVASHFVGDRSISALVVALAGFFLPSAILSTVSPTLVRVQLKDIKTSGRIVGGTSSAGTVGAIFGSLITGFLLVASLSSKLIVSALSITLILIGLALLLRSTVRRRSAIAIAAVIAGTGVGGVEAVTPGKCAVESAYACISVRPDPENLQSGRLLVLDNLIHSKVDLTAPHDLGLGYTQWVGAVARTLQKPARPLPVLTIGAGAFSLPRYIAATFPGGRNDVLERDPRLVKYVQDQFQITADEKMEVFYGDARTSVRTRPQHAYKLIIGDAFGAFAAPWHLTTREYIDEVERHLADGGAYAVNLIDYGKFNFVRAETATMRASFKHVIMISTRKQLAGDEGGNFVVVGSNKPIDVGVLGIDLKTSAPETRIIDGPELTAFIGDHAVLTDDFSPVDKIFTPPPRNDD